MRSFEILSQDCTEKTLKLGPHLFIPSDFSSYSDCSVCLKCGLALTALRAQQPNSQYRCCQAQLVKLARFACVLPLTGPEQCQLQQSLLLQPLRHRLALTALSSCMQL